MKNTKTKLISSVTVLLICFAMLIGSTFAWFTDSASTGVNKIQAGNLDIEAYYQNGVPTDDETINYTIQNFNRNNHVMSFENVKHSLEGANVINETTWEPGKIGTKLITVENKGSLNTIITLKININDNGLESAMWYDFIQIGENNTVSGEFTDSKRMNDSIVGLEAAASLYKETLAPNGKVSFILVYGMDEEAGNQYQGTSLEAFVTVLAKQAPVESDSFGHDYDENAINDPTIWDGTQGTVPSPVNGVVEIRTGGELAATLASIPNGTSEISLMNDINLAGYPWGTYNITNGPLTINGNNHTISGLTKPLVTTANNITITNLTISNSAIGVSYENGLGTAAFVSYLDAYHSATFKNCHLINSSVVGNERAAGIVAYSSGSSLVIEDSSVENCKIESVGGAGGLVAYSQTTPTTFINSSVSKTSVTATEDRSVKHTPVAGGVIGTVAGETAFTNVTVTDVVVSNTNANDVYSETIGRITGNGYITINQ